MSDERAQTLRLELKAWEKEFAAENGGKRPSRADIRNNATIAIKYKEYDKLRGPATQKAESQDNEPPKKASAPAATPQKHSSQFIVPSIPLEQEEDLEPEPTPAAVRIHLGPTPQKDGHILSLFDDLPSTSSKPSRAALATIEANISATPSKPSQAPFDASDSPPAENLHLNHTPASSSKRFLLDSFVSTPLSLKRKREDEDAAVQATPSSSNKGLSTPAFLRRSSNMLIMDTLAEEAEHDDEIKKLNVGRMRQPPFKKRGIVRSLSSMIQGLRKQEDEKLDEELEMMREMEEEEEGGATKPVVQVGDSQVVMPLGPDRGPESDEDDEEEQETGVFRKPWKKKGQKRQTRRVIMRPQPKPKPPTHQGAAQTLSDAETSDHEDSIAETQLSAQPAEDNDTDADSAYSDTEAKRKRQLSKTTTTDTAKDTASTKSKTEGALKKAAKKISATAHANFRKLNIKNQNSKAKAKGRFGRR